MTATAIISDSAPSHNPKTAVIHNSSTPVGFTGPRKRLYRAHLCVQCRFNWTDHYTGLCPDCNERIDREIAVLKPEARYV